jgi:hypothetical protein
MMFLGLEEYITPTDFLTHQHFQPNSHFFVNQLLFYLKVVSVTIEAVSPPAAQPAPPPAAKLLDKGDIFTSISIIFFRSVVFNIFLTIEMMNVLHEILYIKIQHILIPISSKNRKK